jgi:NAD(P)-dependent dehydrogenase (short-subunit alcohol dehydrogenase family)
MRTIFLTGVSSGIGHSLADEYLRRDCHVFGISRRVPADLVTNDRFLHASLDLRQEAAIRPVVGNLLQSVDTVDVAILNAGILGPFEDLARTGLDDLRDVMQVNVWANKLALDSLFDNGRTIRQVVTISSGAAVNGNRGWSGYSISKAALNMLTKLYSREQSGTHFCALAPGVIDTAMIEQLLATPADDRFPALQAIRGKRETDELLSAERASAQLADCIDTLPARVESGEFADIRKL